MTEADAAFARVDLETETPSACSPAPPPPDWRGVVIRAPSVVRLARGVAPDRYGAAITIPICGYLCVDLVPDPPRGDVVLVAVDRASGARRSGELRSLDPSPVLPPPPRPKLRPSEIAGSVGHYFNTNLAWFVPVPLAPATYAVHAEYRGYTSNEVVVRVVHDERDAPPAKP